jgi:hypothetical protein
MHKIEPSLCPWVDAKIANIQKSSGSTHVFVNSIYFLIAALSSVEVLRRRIENLEKCSSQRTKEVSAIKDLSKSIMDEMGRKMDILVRNIDMKVYEKCGSKFDTAEYRIMKVLREELSFLATPSPFSHPEGIDRIDSGAQIFLSSLHNVNLKRRQQELEILKGKNDHLMQSRNVVSNPLTPQPLARVSSPDKEQSSPISLLNNSNLAKEVKQEEYHHLNSQGHEMVQSQQPSSLSISASNTKDFVDIPQNVEIKADLQMLKIDELLSPPDLPEKSSF